MYIMHYWSLRHLYVSTQLKFDSIYVYLENNFFFFIGFRLINGGRLIQLVRKGMRTNQALFFLRIESGIPQIRPWKELLITIVQATWFLENKFWSPWFKHEKSKKIVAFSVYLATHFDIPGNTNLHGLINIRIDERDPSIIKLSILFFFIVRTTLSLNALTCIYYKKLKL